MKKLLFILCVSSTVVVSAQSNSRVKPNRDQIKQQVAANKATRERVEMPARVVAPVTGKQAEYNKARVAQGITFDTRFICVKGDWSSPVPGNCPKHQNALLQDTDPNVGELTYQETVLNKNYGLDLEYAEDHAWLCEKGDYAGYAPGKCVNHPTLDLLNTSDPKTMAWIQSEVKKNPEYFNKMVKAEDMKFACLHGDYTSFKAEKCPVHNADLMSVLNPDFIKKSGEVTAKIVPPAKSK